MTPRRLPFGDEGNADHSPFFFSRLRLGFLISGTVFLVLLLLAFAFLNRSEQTWQSEDGHHELLGVSDGSVFFNDPSEEQDPNQRAAIERINRIFQKIYEENQRVAEGDGAYVRVVLLMPLTVSKSKPSAMPLDHIEHALQGTYTALIRANRSTYFGDPNQVKLQLALVNQGSRQDVSDRLVDAILEVSEPEHPVTAVIGLGSSVLNTEHMVRKLGDRGIPMVSAITSSDTLTGRPNFWSVSPSNIHYVQALRHFLDARQDLKSAIVVRDRNPDPYTSSLAQAFEEHLRPYVKFPELTYTGGTIDQPAQPHVFAPLVTNLCNAVNDRDNPLDTVLYSGRVTDFEFFAKALADRQCRNAPLTILTAATGFASAERYKEILDDGNVTVIYATSCDPVGWLKGAVPAPPDFAAFLQSYEEAGFPHGDLNDGMAIAHHDALATAAMAIRLSPPPHQPADVAAQFGNLVLAYQVRGASGTLSFPADARGRATERSIPIRQIGADAVPNLPENFTPYVVK